MTDNRLARREFIVRGATALALFPVLISKAEGTEEASRSDILLSAVADWIAQDYANSQAIKSVTLDSTTGRLILDTHLVGKHDNYAKGEVYVDLRYFPGLDDKAGIDLSRSQITVNVEVPPGFVGSPTNPNGVQVYVKDTQYRSQYGTWVDVTDAGHLTAKLMPTAGTVPDGYTEPGFDPTLVRIVGIKFAIGLESAATYDGPLYVTGVSIDPPLPLSAPLGLPLSVLPPLLKTSDELVARPDGFYLNNKRLFLIGGSWRAIEYGQNFGTTVWFPTGNGVSKHPNFVRFNFEIMSRAGIKVVRLGLLDDGRTMFDKEGNVTGYNDAFRNDVTVLLDLASQAGLKIELSILDFHIAGRAEELDRVWLRGRGKIITDASIRNQFKSDFVTRFSHEFGGHPALFSVELINEPEWLISNQDGGGWDDRSDSTKPESPIPGEVMHTFFTECIAAMRPALRSKFVTVGTSTKFISLVKGLDIDYFALHHYPFMGPLKHYISQFPNDRPWSLEEFPTRIKPGDPEGATPTSIKGWLKLVSAVGGAGAFLWNLSPGIDEYTFPFSDREGIFLALRKWVKKHPFE